MKLLIAVCIGFVASCLFVGDLTTHIFSMSSYGIALQTCIFIIVVYSAVKVIRYYISRQPKTPEELVKMKLTKVDGEEYYTVNVFYIHKNEWRTVRTTANKNAAIETYNMFVAEYANRKDSRIKNKYYEN